MADERIINKTMERSDLSSDGARGIVEELGLLINEMRKRKLRISSWYGCFELTGNKGSGEALNRGYDYESLEASVDDTNFPWFLYWEIVWVVMNAGFRVSQTVLDLGGSSSLFSYYLASKGMDVTTVDLQTGLVTNANRVAEAMGWKLSNYCMDMRNLKFDRRFDHITSICVFEHIPMFERIRVNGKIAGLLEHGGRFSITFDYKNPSRFAKINTPRDVEKQFVEPSSLRVVGNRLFRDTGQRYLLHPFYHPSISWAYRYRCVRRGHFRPWEILKRKRRNDYTFGALFQEKE